jgi:hypothetical protein
MNPFMGVKRRYARAAGVETAYQRISTFRHGTGKVKVVR